MFSFTILVGRDYFVPLTRQLFAITQEIKPRRTLDWPLIDHIRQKPGEPEFVVSPFVQAESGNQCTVPLKSKPCPKVEKHNWQGHCVGIDTPPPLSATRRDDGREHSQCLMFRYNTRQLWALNETTARLTGQFPFLGHKESTFSGDGQSTLSREGSVEQ